MRYLVFDEVASDNFSFDVKACSPQLVGNPSPDNASCFGTNDGSVTLTFDNDVADGYQMRYYIYQGNPSSFTGNVEAANLPQAYTDHTATPLTNNGNGTYSGTSNTNLEPGSYYIIYQEIQYSGNTVTVKSGEITPQFTIRSPSQIQTNITNTIQPLCMDDTGTVTLSSTGGTEYGNGTLRYSIAGSNEWQASNTFTGLDQGVGYRFISRRSPSCEGTTTALVTINTITNSLVVNDGVSGVIEQAYNPTSANGIIRILTDDGVPNYTYIVTDDDDNSGAEVTRIENTTENPIDISGLLPGNYTIEIQDANGCSAFTSIPLASLPVPQLETPILTPIQCIDEENGGISVAVTDGFGYRWFKDGDPYPGDTATISGLGTGTYELQVIPNGGDFNIPETVVSSGDIFVENPADVIISNPIVTNIDCFGDADGIIQLDVSGGTSYEYFLDDASGWQPLNSNQIPISQGGFYTITVRNQNECLSNTLVDVFVYEPDPLLLFTDIQDEVTSFGGSDGAISVTIEGGTPPYNYEWTADNGFVSFSEDITAIPSGTYTLTVSDSNATTGDDNGCVLVTEFFIGQPDIIVETLIDPTCYLGCDGSISLLVNEGIGDFVYTWDNGMTGKDISGLCQGEYTVTVAVSYTHLTLPTTSRV